MNLLFTANAMIFKFLFLHSLNILLLKVWCGAPIASKLPFGILEFKHNDGSFDLMIFSLFTAICTLSPLNHFVLCNLIIRKKLGNAKK